MIRRAPKDRRRAVKLLGKHHPHKHMRPDHRPKGQRHPRLTAQRRIYAIRSANHKDQIALPRVTLRRDPVCKLRRRHALSTFVENAQD